MKIKYESPTFELCEFNWDEVILCASGVDPTMDPNSPEDFATGGYDDFDNPDPFA